MPPSGGSLDPSGGHEVSQGEIGSMRHHANMSADEPAAVSVQQFEFSDAKAGDILAYKPPIDPTFKDSYEDQASLGSFLSRPVQIFSDSWDKAASGTDGFYQAKVLRPWELYASNPKIREKLSKYAYIRGNLHLKLIVNSTNFVYGDLLAAYQPYTEYAETRAVDNTANAPYTGYVTSLSQRPSCDVSVNTNRGFEMTLPFVHKKNAIRIANVREWNEMGTLTLVSYTPLLSAQGATNAEVEFKLFAWMENVDIYNLTDADALSQDVPIQCVPFYPHSSDYKKFIQSLRSTLKYAVYALVPPSRHKGELSDSGSSLLSEDMEIQSSWNPARALARLSGNEDEYGSTPVSTTATNIGTAAGWIGDVIPEFKPLATATTAAASMTADVASAFGFSDPPVLNAVMPFKDMPFHSLASPDISDPTSKLTLDPKNELSIDPTVIGITPIDELSVTSLVTRRSFLTRSVISVNDHNPPDRLVFNANVTPLLRNSRILPSSTTRELTDTPMGHVATMFKYWRGDINFTFKVVASPFHRGRLRVTWENQQSHAVQDTVSHFTKVFDIQEDKEFTVTIPWLHDNLWLENKYEDIATHFSSASTVSPSLQFENGILRMETETTFTGPDGSDEIYVLVFVSGGSNMAFADPRGPPQLLQLRSAIPLQSTTPSLQLSGDMQIQSSPIDEGTSGPHVIDDDQKILTNAEDQVDHVGLVTMGEAVHSLRPLMRRAVHHLRRYINYEDPSARLKVLNAILPRQPGYPGYDAAGYDTVPSGRYNYVNWLPSAWMRCCFLGERGSYNYKFNLIASTQIDDLAVLRSRDVIPAEPATLFESYTVPYSESSAAASKTWFANERATGWGGMALTNQKTQTGLCVQVPMYSKYRMLNTIKSLRGSSEDGTLDDAFNLRASIHRDWNRYAQGGITTTTGSNPATTTSTGVTDVFLDVYAAAGTDYTLLFFINVPPKYFYSNDIPDPS